FGLIRDRLAGAAEGVVTELFDNVQGVRLGLHESFDRLLSAWLYSHSQPDGKLAVAGESAEFHRLVQFTPVRADKTLYAVATGPEAASDPQKLIAAVNSFDRSRFDRDGYLA